VSILQKKLMERRRLLFLASLVCSIACALAAPRPAGAQVAGDANCDGVRNDADVDALVDRIFGVAPPGSPECRQADVNSDSRVSAPDLIAQYAGPRVTFLGLSGADGRSIPPLGTMPDGTLVYFNNAGFGFNVVVEAAASRDGTPIGLRTRNVSPGDPTARPDLQVQVDRRLGEGSNEICDDLGVPPVDPLDFAIDQDISNALNDLGCRFVVATNSGSACTLNRFGQTSFVSSMSRVQFCFPVSRFTEFQTGQTMLSVQVLDQAGKPGVLKQMMLIVERGPVPATFTPLPPTPTRTPSDTPTATATETNTRTPSRTRTVSPTRTQSATRTETTTRTATPSASRTGTRTSTPPQPATVTRTPATPSSASPTSTPLISPTRTNTVTRTPTGNPSTRTRTPTLTRTPTRTGTMGRTPTRSRTRTPTRTRTFTSTPTAPRSFTPTRTITPTPGQDLGPVVLYFGLLQPDDVVVPPDIDGTVPVFIRPFGFSFKIVVEAGVGAGGRPVANQTFAGFGRPDLQVQVNRPLGNGSAAVCDNKQVPLGGVPAINPPNFSEDPALDNQLNDLGCRFIDGQDNTQGRSCAEDQACVRFETGVFGCINGQTRQQFCAAIGTELTFPPGDTTVSVRVRDTFGNLGPPRQLIVRIQ
jgi:hypothetical protein